MREGIGGGVQLGLAKNFGLDTAPSQEGLQTGCSLNFTDTSVLERKGDQAAKQHTEFLVDMVRTEALDCLGDNRSALTIVDRYI
jgi:hypothetical protein